MNMTNLFAENGVVAAVHAALMKLGWYDWLSKCLQECEKSRSHRVNREFTSCTLSRESTKQLEHTITHTQLIHQHMAGFIYTPIDI